MSDTLISPVFSLTLQMPPTSLLPFLHQPTRQGSHHTIPLEPLSRRSEDASDAESSPLMLWAVCWWRKRYYVRSTSLGHRAGTGFAVYEGLQDLFCHQERAGTVFSRSQSKNFEMKFTSRGLKRHND